MARYRIGNDMTVVWSIYDHTGAAYYLKGKEVRLYYTCERGRFEADFEIQGTNNVVWSFWGREQKVIGDYTLSLEIIESAGKRRIFKDYCNAFTLVGKSCEEAALGNPNISEDGNIVLSSKLDVYKIQPIIPTVGSNSNWFVDGADTGKPSTGKSAYEYAKEKGYEGTESEYAESLKLAPENSEKLAELSEGVSNNSMELESKLNQRLNDEEFYITDKEGNVIAKINSNGVHSVDFSLKIDGISQFISIILKHLEQSKLNQTLEDNRLCITDANGYIIAKLDADGIHAPNLFEGTYNDKQIIITDANGYIIAKLDADGIHSAKDKHAVACMVLSESYYPISPPIRDRDDNIISMQVIFETGVEGKLAITYLDGNASKVDVVYGHNKYGITIKRDNKGNVETVKIDML